MLRIVGPALAAVAYNALLLSVYDGRLGGGVASLCCVADRWAGHYPYEAVPAPPADGRFGAGYDGQFFYVLARAPWARHDQGVDTPPYRQARLLYPLFCCLVSGGGDPQRLLWALPLVNVLVAGGLAALGAAVALRNGLSPWWGVLLPSVVSADLASLRNLGDGVSALMICGLLVAWLWRGPWWALGLLAVGTLFSRQQNALVVLSVLAVAGWHRRWADVAALTAALALFAAWVLRLRLLYGDFPVGTDETVFAPPFVGLVQRWSELGLGAPIWINLLYTGLLTIEMLLIAYMIRLRSDAALVLAALSCAALALACGKGIYEDFWCYARAFNWLAATLWLAAAQARRRWLLVLPALPMIVPWMLPF